MPRSKQTRKKSSMLKKPKKSRSLAANNAVSVPNTSHTSDVEDIVKQYDSLDNFQTEFDICYNSRIKWLQEGYQRACDYTKIIISDFLQVQPDYYCNAKLQENMESLVEDQNKDPNTTTASKVRQSRPRKVVESFEFKKPKAPERSSKRSSSRKRSASATAAHTDGFKTPTVGSRIYQSGMTITPKIYSNTPMSVMRRPLHGEVAISMSGSPLMVGAISREDIPTVSVPLQDGRIFSIIPQPGEPPADLPHFDEETKKYLQTLRAHLKILAPNSP